MPVLVNAESPVATVTLSNAGRRNAIDLAMRGELPRIFQRLDDDAAIRAIILTGEGDDFCAGADIKEESPPGMSGAIVKMRLLQRMVRAVTAVRTPVVAAVRGNCLGLGWSLALACDFIVAAEDATFQFAFANIGLVPDGAGSYQLVRHLGLMRAREIIYLGRTINGVEAHALGLAIAAPPAAHLVESARAMAERLAAAPTLALGMAKTQLDAAAGQNLDQALELEAAMQPLALRSEDHREGITALRERRTPRFQGG